MSTIDRVVPPAGALLVRVLAHGADWLERLPAVPAGHVVTVSVTDSRLRDVPPRRLLARGYRVVGVRPAADTALASLYLLVTADLVREHPDWWQALGVHADRAFDLRHGPVQRVLGPEIALHLPR